MNTKINKQTWQNKHYQVRISTET